jgi:hypothetical protein
LPMTIDITLVVDFKPYEETNKSWSVIETFELIQNIL